MWRGEGNEEDDYGRYGNRCNDGSLALFGCGGGATQSIAQSAAQSISTQQAPASTAVDSPATSSATQAATKITPEEAMQIALADAGLSQNDVTDLRAESDIDDVIPHYDVDFRQGNLEYDYDIDRATGSILTKSVEVDD